MQASKRYTLLKVFLVVLAVNLLLFIVGFLVITFLQTSEYKDNNRNMLTANYLGKELFGLIFQTIFYYFSLNHFNRLMVKKSRAFYYIRAAGVMIIGVLVIMRPGISCSLKIAAVKKQRSPSRRYSFSLMLYLPFFLPAFPYCWLT
ncbi:MAG: hypothetical protein IPG38_16875 [Chitinophagaceae bacterium]|nr:hypothetical protein [Chitinophagaceae bacterium]